MNQVTIVFPYYENPWMLGKQFEIIYSYPDWVRENIEVIVVDDCSPRDKRAETLAKYWPPERIKLRLFRILTKVSWNWPEARNIGAFHAAHNWVFLTDIDHIIPSETAEWMVRETLDDNYYRFPRCLYPSQKSWHPHPNTLLVHKSDYWLSGGYDEGYAGHYGVGERMFFPRLEEFVESKMAPHPVLLVKRDVIPDASTTTLLRKEGIEPGIEEDILRYKVEHSRRVAETFKQPFKEIRL